MNAITFTSAYGRLSPVEKAFVDDYVAAAEKAAERAGERISTALRTEVPASIVEASNGLLARPMVTTAIAERITQIDTANEVTMARLVKEYASIAFASIENYMETDVFSGDISFNFDRAPPEVMAAVKSIETEITQTGSRRMKVVLHDKIKALDALGKIIGAFNEDNEYMAAQRRNTKDAQRYIDKKEDAGEAYARYIG